MFAATNSLPLVLYQTALQRGLLFEDSVEGNPTDRLRIVVQDQASGLAGSLWLTLEQKSEQRSPKKSIP